MSLCGTKYEVWHCTLISVKEENKSVHTFHKVVSDPFPLRNAPSEPGKSVCSGSEGSKALGEIVVSLRSFRGRKLLSKVEERVSVRDAKNNVGLDFPPGNNHEWRDLGPVGQISIFAVFTPDRK